MCGCRWCAPTRSGMSCSRPSRAEALSTRCNARESSRKTCRPGRSMVPRGEGRVFPLRLAKMRSDDAVLATAKPLYTHELDDDGLRMHQTLPLSLDGPILQALLDLLPGTLHVKDREY